MILEAFHKICGKLLLFGIHMFCKMKSAFAKSKSKVVMLLSNLKQAVMIGFSSLSSVDT